LGDDHPLVAVSLAKLAALHHARHRDGEARASWESVLRIRRAAQDSPRELADALYGYGLFLADVGEFQAALEAVEEVLALHRSKGFDDPVASGRAEYVLGECLARVGRREEARPHLAEAARLLDASPGATPDERAHVRRSLLELDRPAER
jgi:tetratricopeptide (TPR) repeat protein